MTEQIDHAAQARLSLAGSGDGRNFATDASTNAIAHALLALVEAQSEANRRVKMANRIALAPYSGRVNDEIHAERQSSQPVTDAEVIAALNAWQDRKRLGTSLGEWGSFKVERMRAALEAARIVRGEG